MGGHHSKEKGHEEVKSFVASIKSNLNDEIARRMMIQREIQMAVNIAKARDTIWIFGSAWATFTTGVVTARTLGRAVPPVAFVPVVVGGLVLGNMADMAYGNKLQRVTKEAEKILDYERGRLVPFSQAPFAKFYSDEEKEILNQATAVGDLFPNSILFTNRALPAPKDKS